MLQKIPMTVAGAEQLKKELEQLKATDRPKVIQAIADARANGDLKENADYQAAREQQAFIEGRILDLEHKLSNSQVIDISKIHNDGKVIFGAKVSLEIISTRSSQADNHAEHKITYIIVGDEEANLKEHKLSVSSPLSRALIGKYEGEEVQVNAPSGVVKYNILKVEYI